MEGQRFLPGQADNEGVKDLLDFMINQDGPEPEGEIMTHSVRLFAEIEGPKTTRLKITIRAITCWNPYKINGEALITPPHIKT